MAKKTKSAARKKNGTKKAAPRKRAAKAAPAAKAAVPGTRADSKQARLIEMLRRPNGVTIDEITKAFDWQAHTVRGAFAGALKKKLGLVVTSEKDESRGRVYRLDAP
jgi:Protein of unknown function (DUF3489)